LDIVFSMIAFFALVASWFVLPAAPRNLEAKTSVSPDGLASAA
jgi:hypothetical protein